MLLSVFIILLCCFIEMPTWLMVFGIVASGLNLLYRLCKIVATCVKAADGKK